MVRLLFFSFAALAADADLILHNGQILTVDRNFTIAQAMAVKNGKIVRVGASAAVVQSERSAKTRVVDLQGKTVLPGLIDSHVHAIGAGLSEWKAKLPPLDSIDDIQNFIKERAKTTPAGEWIVVPRTLPPRLKEQRYPTRAELDKAAPKNPVIFATGPDASINSLALFCWHRMSSLPFSNQKMRIELRFWKPSPVRNFFELSRRPSMNAQDN